MPSVAVHSATRLIGIAPQFLVDDLDRAIAYYRDKLGFELDFKYQSFYASVTRDGFAIHLKHAPKLAGDREHRKQNEHLDGYISVSGIRGLFSELEMRGAQVIRPLEARPWACLDFYVEDPDGYILCFSEQNA
jgi:catechol 2,3-dioxygenase-like lactoylglutathione lyase family enzyme